MLSGNSVWRSGVPTPGRPPPAPPPPAPTSSPAASSAVGLVPAESTESRSCSMAAPAAAPDPDPGPRLDEAAVSASVSVAVAPPRGSVRLARPRQPRPGLRPLPAPSGPGDWLSPSRLPRLALPAARSQSLPPPAMPEADPARTPISSVRGAEGGGAGAEAGCQGDSEGASGVAGRIRVTGVTGPGSLPQPGRAHSPWSQTPRSPPFPPPDASSARGHRTPHPAVTSRHPRTRPRPAATSSGPVPPSAVFVLPRPDAPPARCLRPRTSLSPLQPTVTAPPPGHLPSPQDEPHPLDHRLTSPHPHPQSPPPPPRFPTCLTPAVSPPP